MAAGRLIFPGLMPVEDANGDRVPGARAYLYVDGAPGTFQDTFTTSALDVAHPNPVEADDVGTWPAIWADTTDTYTVAITDEDGVPLPNATWSGLGPAIDATLASVALALAAQTAAEAAQDAAEAAELQAEAAAATVTGGPFTGTSITNLTIGTGSKTFTLQQTGKLFSIGQTIVIAETADGNAQMIGALTAVDNTTGIMTANITTTGGAGSASAWTVSLGTQAGVTSIAGEVGIVTAAEAKAALAITTADVSDFVTAVNARAIAFALAL